MRQSWLWQTVTPGGAFLLGTSALGLVLGIVFGWTEFFAPAVVAVVLLVLASLFLIGRKHYRVDLRVNRSRVVAGSPIETTLSVTNSSATLALPTRLDVPVGGALVEVPIPLLRVAAGFTQTLDIPTNQRGVVQVGPVQKLRSSPLGILRSVAIWGSPRTIFVHPRTVALPPTDVGLLRDLEGLAAGKTAPDDLSFHAIREYTAGDPRNQIHWKSTAKAGRLMVRQYDQSVRSEMLVILDSQGQSYADGDEFELAVSVTTSFAVRGLLDGRHLSVFTGPHGADQTPGPKAKAKALKTTSREALLDGMTRLRWVAQDPALGATRGVNRVAPGGPVQDWALPDVVSAASALSGRRGPISVVVLVTGSRVSVGQIQAATRCLPIGVGALAVRCASDGSPGLRVESVTARGTATGIAVLTVAVLDDLRHLLLRQVQR